MYCESWHLLVLVPFLSVFFLYFIIYYHHALYLLCLSLSEFPFLLLTHVSGQPFHFISALFQVSCYIVCSVVTRSAVYGYFIVFYVYFYIILCIFMLFYYFFIILCIVCVYMCTNHCHRVLTQLQLTNISISISKIWQEPHSIHMKTYTHLS
jgi:hypothetical protein